MNVKQMARLGGLAVSKKYGRDHYLRLAEHMNKMKKEKKHKKALDRDNLAIDMT